MEMVERKDQHVAGKYSEAARNEFLAKKICN
jgi:hypothetical protein